MAAAAAMSSDRDHATPLSFSTDRQTTSDEEDSAAAKTHDQRNHQLLLLRRRRRRCLACGGSCLAVLLVVVVVLVVVALTVFKVKEPVMTMNSVTFKNLAFDASSSLSVNMTVVADVSVKNPNAATFRYGGSTTSLYYGSRRLAVAYGPPGTARAHRTVRVNLTVDVIADAILSDLDLVGGLAAGEVNVTTSTKVGGRVKILGMFKHHVDVMMNCSLTVAVANQSITNHSCNQKVWL